MEELEIRRADKKDVDLLLPNIFNFSVEFVNSSGHEVHHFSFCFFKDVLDCTVVPAIVCFQSSDSLFYSSSIDVRDIYLHWCVLGDKAHDDTFDVPFDESRIANVTFDLPEAFDKEKAFFAESSGHE